MLLIVAVVCGLLWLVGSFTSYTLGGYIHVLIPLALLLFFIQIFKGTRLAKGPEKPRPYYKRGI